MRLPNPPASKTAVMYVNENSPKAIPQSATLRNGLPRTLQEKKN